MSHLKAPLRMALTERRGSKKIFSVDPLKDAASPALDLEALKFAATEAATRGLDDLKVWWDQISSSERTAIKPHMEEIKQKASVPPDAGQALADDVEHVS